ncbi:hypothetical protein GLOIN_2v1472826 [Rhizophagus clarus]|uniref:C2H2-type domain-containing protein n=1 Tax=Rhizophagus clarus TaxID=94130 RepID=A0A8H3QFT7_9GLOM|nr:hypothetical protein GLOIN_2v1472826 [Rhizophagus clarus]
MKGKCFRTLLEKIIRKSKKSPLKQKQDDENLEPLPKIKRSKSTITLMYLITENAITNAFAVNINSNKLISHFKKVIKVQKMPEFDNFSADKLKLWKVEIPDHHDDQLSNLSLQVQDQLFPTKKISKYFPIIPAEKYINIIVSPTDTDSSSDGKSLNVYITLCIYVINSCSITIYRILERTMLDTGTKKREDGVQKANEAVLQAIVKRLLPSVYHVPELSLIMDGAKPKGSGRFGFSDVFAYRRIGKIGPDHSNNRSKKEGTDQKFQTITNIPMSKTSFNSLCNKFECELCGKIYKRHSGLANHKITIKDANIMRPTVYDLPERAIEETRQILIYHIKERLKQSSKHAGNVRVMFSCTESQFFGVFKGYIHDYFPKTGNYKCIFKGINSYSTLSKVLGDDNWGVKYFLQHQKTFVLSYQQPSNPNDPDPLLESNLCQKPDPLQVQDPDPLQEPNPLQDQDSDPLQEPDPLQDQNQVNIYKAKKRRICKPKPVQIIIGWKRKEKSDVRNIVYSSGFIFINFIISRMKNIENFY